MANTVGGSVVWNLDVEKDKLSQGLVDAKKEVDEVARDIDKSFSSISKSISNSFKGMGESMKSMGKNMTEVGGSMTKMITLPIVAATAAALSFVEIGGKYSSVKDAFISMTKDMGINADEFQARVSRATGGQIDNLKILTSATKGLSLIGKEAFNNFGDDFVKMAELSKKAARATGLDVDFMFESLVTGIARESKLILDNLGISIDITKAKDEYAVSLGKTNEELTISEEKHAVLNAALVQLEKVYGDVAISAGGFSGVAQQLKTSLTNARIEIGQALEPELAKLTKSLVVLVSDVTPKLVSLIKSIVDGFSNMSPVMQKVTLGAIGFAAIIGPTITILGMFISNLGVLTIAFGSLIGKIPAVIAIIKSLYLLLLANPYILIGAAVIGLAVLIYKNWDNIVRATSVAWNWIGSLMGSIGNYISNTWSNVLNFLSGLAGRIVSAIVWPFEEAKRKIESVANAIREAANKINPFYRKSPSLVDNVKAGLGLIKDQYAQMGDFIMSPNVTPAVSSVIKPEDFVGNGGNTSNNNTNIYIDKVSNQQDIDALGREFGYRQSLIP